MQRLSANSIELRLSLTRQLHARSSNDRTDVAICSRPMAVACMLASLVVGTLLSTATAAPTQPSGIAQPAALVTSWRRIEQCPVLVEESVEVPARESGVIVELAVELNQAISPDGLIAKLDQEQAVMGVEMAKLKHQSALSLAEDNSEVDYQQLALQEIQNELTSYEKISKSVSNSEIRRLNLQVGKARLALVRARQASARAKVEAGVLATEIKLAENRLTRRSVVSPLGGIVASVDKQVGQWVQAGETIATVENLSELGVDAILPVNSIDRGSIVGTPVRVVVLPDTPGASDKEEIRLPGQVISYDHKVSSRGLIRLHCRVRNTTHRGSYLLLPGANVDLEIANTESNSTASNRQRVSPQSVSR